MLLANMKIGSRILLALLLPILGLIFFAGNVVLDRNQVFTEMESLQELAGLVPSISGVVHELQKERGTSAVYIGSKSAKFKAELPVQHADTDKALAVMKAVLANFDAQAFGDNLVGKLNTAQTALSELNAKRNGVKSFDLTVLEMAGYYTQTIAELLSIVEEMAVLSSSAGISNTITAYTSFLQAKERAGQERAMGGAGFGVGQFAPPVYRRLIELIAEQQVLFKTFAVYASAEQRAFLETKVMGPDVGEVERMRKIAVDSQYTDSTEDIQVPYWFGTITKKIDLMKMVEDKIADDLMNQVGAIQAKAQTEFYTFLILTIVLVVVTAVLVMVIVKGITRPIISLTNVMGVLANGDTSVEITGLERGDEIGSMSQAVEVFKENMVEMAKLTPELQRLLLNLQNLKFVLDHHSIVATTDVAGRITYANDKLVEISGYSHDELIGQNHRLLKSGHHPPEFYKQLWATISGGDVWHGEICNKAKDGSLYWVETTIAPQFDLNHKIIQYTAIRTDVTRIKKTEELLRRSHKMEAVGALTGGIAHDFNNLLGIIVGNLDLMHRKIDDGSKLQKQLESAQRAALRGASITRRLLNFSRQNVEAHSAISLNNVLDEFEDLIRKSLRANVDVEINQADYIWMVDVNPGDFEDALVNLCLNARDAMPEGGTIIIESGNTSLDHTVAGFKGLEPGDYVQVAVSDTGNGISKEIVDKIFDPFFTTKEKGKGTGLGLAMVYGFVQRSKGHLSVYSEQGVGTTFRMYFPRSLSMVEQMTGPKEVDTALPTGTETILIVDDEEDLADIAKNILGELGYETICARNGSEALQILANNKGIDLLFSDVVMPGGINGFDLANTVSELYPKVKILLTSGFTGQMKQSDSSERLAKKIVMKPYRGADLATRVRETLDESATP